MRTKPTGKFGHITQSRYAPGRGGVCFPLKPKYDRLALTLAGQETIWDETIAVSHDEFGVPTITQHVQLEDITVDEKTDNVLKIESQANKIKIIKKINKNEVDDIHLLLDELAIDHEEADGGGRTDDDSSDEGEHTEEVSNYKGEVRT